MEDVNNDLLEIVNAQDIYNGNYENEDLDEDDEEAILNEATIQRLARRNLRSTVSYENADRLFNALTVMEVLGLESSTHGRACEQHICCGHWVRKGDTLHVLKNRRRFILRREKQVKIN